MNTTKEIHPAIRTAAILMQVAVCLLVFSVCSTWMRHWTEPARFTLAPTTKPVAVSKTTIGSDWPLTVDAGKAYMKTFEQRTYTIFEAEDGVQYGLSPEYQHSPYLEEIKSILIPGTTDLSAIKSRILPAY